MAHGPTFVEFQKDYGNLKRGTRKRVISECRDGIQLSVQGRPVWVPMYCGIDRKETVPSSTFRYVESLDAPAPFSPHEGELV
jgi:hypothetical protein